MKAVMLSVRPKWCDKIANGKKMIEVRKNRPRLETPFKCYIYCTKPKFDYEDYIAIHIGTEKARDFFGGGKVIGEFICDEISKIQFSYENIERYAKIACLTSDELAVYLRDKNGYSLPIFYGWHISNLVIYDKPKKLSKFMKPCPNQGDCNDCIYKMPWNCKSGVCEYREYGGKITRPPQSWCYAEEVSEE